MGFAAKVPPSKTSPLFLLEPNVPGSPRPRSLLKSPPTHEGCPPLDSRLGGSSVLCRLLVVSHLRRIGSGGGLQLQNYSSCFSLQIVSLPTTCISPLSIWPTCIWGFKSSWITSDVFGDLIQRGACPSWGSGCVLQ